MARPPVYKDRSFEFSLDPCWNSSDTTFKSQSLDMYEFEYFKWKYVRIKSEISGLVEGESANFFLGR